jgi:tetratricopeptide (TPR) repeat protein
MTKRITKASQEEKSAQGTSVKEKTTAQEEKSPSQPQKSLYEKEMERYRIFLQHGFDVAYKYYGFSLFHSLSNEEKVEILKKLGFEPKNPEDFYNLGCMAAKREDFAAARNFFEKTIALAADFEQAYYNLALTLESLGQDKDAIRNWEIYNEFLDEDSSDTLLVSQHIAELKGTKAESKGTESK